MNKPGRPRTKKSKGTLYGLGLPPEEEVTALETIEREGTTTRRLLRKLLRDWVAEQNGKNLF